jgi:predicted transcriptional regulator
MAEKKMTKKEMFAMLKQVVNKMEATEENFQMKVDMLVFIDHEIDLLERKSSKSATTKTQTENEKIMVQLQEILAEAGKPMTVTELMPLVGLSNQKISALLRIMKERGEVVKTIDKKKSYFSLAE